MASAKGRRGSSLLRLATDGYPLYPSALEHLFAAGGRIEQAGATFAAALEEWAAVRIPDAITAARCAPYISSSRDGALDREASFEDEARAMLVPDQIHRQRVETFRRSSRVAVR